MSDEMKNDQSATGAFGAAQAEATLPWVGKKLGEDDVALLMSATGAGMIRIKEPGKIYTMEFRMGRLNAHLDANGVVASFSWG